MNELFVNKKKYREKKEKLYSRQELKSFYGAALGAYRHIMEKRPDVIIAPLRGAHPIIKAIQLIANEEKNSSKMPLVYYPKIGEINLLEKKGAGMIKKIPQKMTHALSEGAKAERIRAVLKRACEKNGCAKIMVVDEANQGGTIVKHLKMLAESTREIPVSITAAVIASPKKKKEEYEELVKSGIIKPFQVKRIFTLDSQHFLPPLVRYENEENGTVHLIPTKRESSGQTQLLFDLQAEHRKRRKTSDKIERALKRTGGRWPFSR